MTRRYGAKKDANHLPITKLLDKLGIPYIDLSKMGCGIPDLLVLVGCEIHMWEIKNMATAYGRNGLNKLQTAFAMGWRGGPVYLIHSEDEALAFVNGDRSKLSKVGGYVANEIPQYSTMLKASDGRS